MSRTTRRPKFYLTTSETNEIMRDLERAIRIPYKSIKVPLTEEELDKEYARRVKQYKESGYWAYYWPQHFEAPIRPTKLYKRVQVEKDIEEVITKAKANFATYTRDGKWNETGRNTGFKYAAKKQVRKANKRFCKVVLQDQDYDNITYPHDHLGDYLVWCFW